MEEKVREENIDKRKKINSEVNHQELQTTFEIAQEKSTEEIKELEAQAEKEEKQGKIKFWELIKIFRKFCRGEIDTEGNMTPIIMSSFTSFLAGIFSLIFKITSLVLFLGIIAVAIVEMNWVLSELPSNITKILFAIIISGILLLLSTMLKIIEKDIEKSKDKNYVLSVFSALLGFGALIIAILALVK